MLMAKNGQRQIPDGALFASKPKKQTKKSRIDDSAFFFPDLCFNTRSVFNFAVADLLGDTA